MDINNLSGHDFEDLVEKLIKQLGFITEERKRSADGGIDIKAINEQPILKGLYIIQCKRHSNPISESTIRDLFGVVTSERANKGILITNSTFSKAAEKFASNLPIELIDGSKLIELLEKNLSKKFEKENEKPIIHEKYRITFKYLNAEAKRIDKRRQDIKNKRIYLNPKYYNDILAYINYINKKIDKIRKIVVVLSNQIFDLNDIWDNFPENQGNYSNMQELKDKCKKIMETINIIENEEEELISVIPQNNLKGLHTAAINIYNPIFKSFFEFLNKLYLMINNPEDPRLEKFLKNGKQYVKLDTTITPGDTPKIYLRELEKVKRELVRSSKAREKRCYIATAVYKDSNAPEVIKLRQWRDDVLCNNAFGKLSIEVYYFFGKYLANLIKKFPVLRLAIKYLLDLFISRL